MSAKKKSPDSGKIPHRVSPNELRWKCNPDEFAFRTTAEMDEAAIDIIGQPRALEAMRLGLAVRSDGYNIFVSGEVGRLMTSTGNTRRRKNRYGSGGRQWRSVFMGKSQ